MADQTAPAAATNETNGQPAMLEIQDLYVGYYQDLNILQGVDLKARKAKITAILGANGVGKSTLLKAIYGFLKPNSGKVLLEGKNVVGTPTYKLIDMGLAYIPQHPGIFRWMSIEENLEMGAYTFRKDKTRINRKLEEIYQRFPVLKERRKSMAGKLSGGQQRMVEVGRTLMTDPKVMLVDEPTAGLAKLLSEEVYEMLVKLKESGITILLVDQEIRQAMKIADYVYVLELGRNKYEGPVSDFSSPADIKKAFWA
jgi:branched-chain amino acid transport system ATP-binding protein